MLLREVDNAHIKHVDPNSMLQKLFPDEVLPGPIEALSRGLSTGKSAIIRRNPRNDDRVWVFEPQGITSASKPETHESQTAKFISNIIESAEKFYKGKAKSHRQPTGKFCTIPLTTDGWKIARKPDITGVTSEDLETALSSSPPSLGWSKVQYIIEIKKSFHDHAAFTKKCIPDVLNKGFCQLHTQIDRRFSIVVTITGTQVRVSVCDRGGVIHTDPFDYNEHPELFLRLIMGLSFADDIYLGRDPSIKQESNGNWYITVNEKKYEILDKFWRAAMISGRATTCLRCRSLDDNKIYVIKDGWIIASRLPTEVFFHLEAEAANVVGVAHLADWEEVKIGDNPDQTDYNRGRFNHLHNRIHVRLVFEGFAEPIWTFDTKEELISAFIDYIECKHILNF